jgi:hypothetical protein
VNRYSEKVMVRGSRFVDNTDPSHMRARPTGKILVRPSNDPYWRQSGWENTWDGYAGYYHAGENLRWRGMSTVFSKCTKIGNEKCTTSDRFYG